MTSYSSIVQELFDLQKFAIKLGLDNIRFLCDQMSNPQNTYPVIHVAGTNGKGSTSFFTASILQAMGLKTGLFTSPHLMDFRERVTVNGKKISRAFVSSFWDEYKKIILRRRATFFDTTTAMALLYFKEQKVDVAIIETGLGGRLDSTNVVRPEIAVITPIHFDHEKQLGSTLGEIAAEKAGIIKPGCAVFSAAQNGEALAALKQRLAPEQAFFYLPEILKFTLREETLAHTRFDISDRLNTASFSNIFSRQLGGFQAENQCLAYSVSRFFIDQQKRSFSEALFRTVLADTIWPGRLQRIRKNPDVLFDVSHNFAGISRTMEFLQRLIPKQNLHILIGMVDDKDYGKSARFIAERAARITVTEPQTHRKLPAQTLAKALSGSNIPITSIKDFYEAYEFSYKQLQKGHTLLVTGSHYLTGVLLEKQKPTQSDFFASSRIAGS